MGSDVFWQVVLCAFQAGYRHAILDRYRDPQLLADLVKAQAFQCGRSPDELSRRLEASYLERRAVLGALLAHARWQRQPVAYGAIRCCWEFDDVDGLHIGHAHRDASASASRISATSNRKRAK